MRPTAVAQTLLGRRALVAARLALFAFAPVRQTRAQTEDAVVLEVSGAILGVSPRRFGLDEIMLLPTVSMETLDPWDSRVRRYVGTPLLAMLEAVGLQPAASGVEVIAANTYRITISLGDLRRYRHILSYEMDGLPYFRHGPASNKGPLAVAIDFEATGAEPVTFKHHLAWSVTTLVVR